MQQHYGQQHTGHNGPEDCGEICSSLVAEPRTKASAMVWKSCEEAGRKQDGNMQTFLEDM